MSLSKKLPSQPRQLLPQSSTRLPSIITPATAIFGNQSEYQYFQHFREEITHDLSGAIPQPMWNCVILRACNDSLPLRDLTCSVAALSMARDSALKGSGNDHHVFAARYYGRALRGIQTMINTANEADASRLTLLASLLIFCFESLQGESANALEHIKVAMGMMRNRFATSRRYYSPIRRIESIPGLEDELLEIFVRLDNTLTTTVSSPGDRGLLEMRYEIGEEPMPDRFRDLSEARNYLNHHMYCAMPYLARLPQIFMQGSSNSSQEEDLVGPRLLDQLRDWHAAFAPLLKSAWERPTSKDFIAAATLRSLVLVAEISVRKISARAGTMDLFVKEACEIVDLTRRIVMDSSFRKTFVFECGILPALFLTVMLCPERRIREDIIQVLKLAEGRIEVTWNAVEVAKIAESFISC